MINITNITNATDMSNSTDNSLNNDDGDDVILNTSKIVAIVIFATCLLYTSPSPRD